MAFRPDSTVNAHMRVIEPPANVDPMTVQSPPSECKTDTGSPDTE
jgi:hypothetical protein